MARRFPFLMAMPLALLGLSYGLSASALAQFGNAATTSPHRKATVSPKVQSSEVAPLANRIVLEPSGAVPSRDGNNELNQAVDATLGKFASANADNPKALLALQDAAAQIVQNTQAFISADGSVNKNALADLIMQKFLSAGSVTIPSTGSGGERMSENVANLGDKDIMALALIVMMEAAKSARDDLKAVMEEVRTINKQKERLRHTGVTTSERGTDCVVADGNCTTSGAGGMATNRVPPLQDAVHSGHPVTKNDIDAGKETVKGKLDNMSELGGIESLRLQMASDRVFKLMSTLSNLLPKETVTDSDITKNIK